MKYVWIIVLIPLGLLSSGNFYRSPLKTSQEIIRDIPELRSHISNEMRKNGITGLSLAVICSNRIIYAEGFGTTDTKGGRLVDTNSLFQAASISKVITAYASLRMTEQGSLSLDEPLDSRLKRKFLPADKYSHMITLRMILNHTSGLPNNSDGRIRNLQFIPGTRFLYSGCGFRYLQSVMEQVSLMPFERLIREQVFIPLKMDRSTFVSYPDRKNSLAGFFGIRIPRVNAAYSMVSTPLDIARFLIEILNPRFMAKNTMNLMTAPSIPVNDDVSWGLGIGIQHGPEGDAYWQWGNNDDICHSFFVVFRNSMTGVVIMLNGKNGRKSIKRIASRTIGGSHLSYMDVLDY
jgi:CubicO group peptidase (beta-lactamase class C family)